MTSAELFVRFAIVSVLAFGGGQAALPLVERMVVSEAGWLSASSFGTAIAFGYLTPGPVLITATFVGRIGLAVLLATVVGAFSPLCACTVVPVISGLLHSGVPLAPVMSFWIASPTMDPEKFALTVSTLGWPLAAARLAATVILSLGAGYLTLRSSAQDFSARTSCGSPRQRRRHRRGAVCQ